MAIPMVATNAVWRDRRVASSIKLNQSVKPCLAKMARAVGVCR